MGILDVTVDDQIFLIIPMMDMSSSSPKSHNAKGESCLLYVQEVVIHFI